MVKKFEDMFIRFDMIHERDRQTDRQTDGHRITAIAAAKSTFYGTPVFLITEILRKTASPRKISLK